MAQHELSDAWPGWIFGIIVFLAVCGFAIHLILAGAVHGLYALPTRPDNWQPVAQVRPPATLAPAIPRLQISPAQDLSSFRAREETELNTYGWINRTAGVVRLPIRRAMDLLLERGVPVRGETNPVGPSSWEQEQQRPLHREREVGGPP